MIYLENKEGSKISTNDDEMAVKFEEMGYTKLSKAQVFWQKIMVNIVLEYLLPMICGTITFVVIREAQCGNGADFVLAYFVGHEVAGALSPLKKWD